MAAAIVPTPPLRWRQGRHELALPFVFRGPSNYIQIKERTGQTDPPSSYSSSFSLSLPRLPRRGPPQASCFFVESFTVRLTSTAHLTSFVTWRVYQTHKGGS